MGYGEEMNTILNFQYAKKQMHTAAKWKWCERIIHYILLYYFENKRYISLLFPNWILIMFDAQKLNTCISGQLLD